MTIVAAYEALRAAVASELGASGYLWGDVQLSADPVAALSVEGAAAGVQTAAALYEVRTREVRTLLGGPAARYVVERECRLELAAFAADPAERDAVLARGLMVVASLVAGADPTLGGACERLLFSRAEPEDIPPDGLAQLITLLLRVRSGDPLGLTP